MTRGCDDSTPVRFGTIQDAPEAFVDLDHTRNEQQHPVKTFFLGENRVRQIIHKIEAGRSQIHEFGDGLLSVVSIYALHTAGDPPAVSISLSPRRHYAEHFADGIFSSAGGTLHSLI